MIKNAVTLSVVLAGAVLFPSFGVSRQSQAAEQQTSDTLEPTAFLALGNQQINQREYLAAERTFRQGLRAHPDNIALRNQVGLALIQQQRYSEAGIHLQAIIKDVPSDPAAYWYLGVCRYDEGQYQKAIPPFQSAIELLPKEAPQIPYAHWYIGSSLQMLLGSEGLTYAEVDQMAAAFKAYIVADVASDGAANEKGYLEWLANNRPSSNAKRWVHANSLEDTIDAVKRVLDDDSETESD